VLLSVFNNGKCHGNAIIITQRNMHIANTQPLGNRFGAGMEGDFGFA